MERIKNSSANEVACIEAKREANLRELVDRAMVEVDHLKKVIAEKEALAAQS